MKKLIFAFLCHIALLAGITQATDLIGDGTTDNPYQLECNNCYSDFAFKNEVKAIHANNTFAYYLVFNSDTQVLKTIHASHYYDPFDNINFSMQRIVSTDESFIADFEDYMLFLHSGAEKQTLELDYPSSGEMGASSFAAYTNRLPALSLQAWVLSNVNLSPFTFRRYSHVTVSFSNGDKAKFAVTGFASAANFPLLIVVDKDGNVISMLGMAATVSHSGGGAGTPGGYTTFSFPSGVTLCYGECPVRRGYVIITQDD